MFCFRGRKRKRRQVRKGRVRTTRAQTADGPGRKMEKGQLLTPSEKGTLLPHVQWKVQIKPLMSRELGCMPLIPMVLKARRLQVRG